MGREEREGEGRGGIEGRKGREGGKKEKKDKALAGQLS